MRKIIKMNLMLAILAIFVAIVNCVPTSVLAESKDSILNNNSKVKRSSSTETQSSTSSGELSPSNHKIGSETSSITGKSEISLGPIRQNAGLTQDTKSMPQKRGINSQLMYGDLFNTIPVGPPRNGVWADELDPAVIYPDIQEFDDYQRNSYNMKPYDNIREILNSEPVALPLQYPYRYYGDRRKRSNVKPLDMRLKRDSKLTPADMLALVALVEAGERSRMENEKNEENYGEYPRYLGSYNPQIEEDNDDVFADPANYVSSPYGLDSVPIYDIVKPAKTAQRYGSKRFMVSKKKRSLAPYPSELSDRSNLKFGNRYPSLSHHINGLGPKRYQNAF